MLRLLAFLVPLTVLAAAVCLLLVNRGSAPRVSGLFPPKGSRDVPITSPIRMTFARPMDPSSVESRFGTQPEVDGRFRWVGNEMIFQPLVAFTPTTAYTVTLTAGAVGESGRTLETGLSWGFHTRAPQLLYLGRPGPEAQQRQLYAITIGDPAPRQLTDHAFGVWDYAVHPEGDTIIASVLRAEGGSDLWRMDRDGGNQDVLLACPDAACLGPVWSPDGRWVAYERRDIWADAPNLDPKAARIWLLDVEANDQQPLFDYDVPLHSPVWAPAGEQLAYVSPLIPGIETLDLASGDMWQFGNQWGQAPTWSPDGSELVTPDVMLVDQALVVRLVRVDVEQERLLDISGDDLLVKDQGPAWSPAGGWIAFGRQYLEEGRWTPGRQIWMVRPDGSEAYPLVTDPMGDLFGLAWRPDGAALAYLRDDLSEGPLLVPRVSVWVFDLVARETVLVADDGVLPRWLP